VGAVEDAGADVLVVDRAEGLAVLREEPLDALYISVPWHRPSWKATTVAWVSRPVATLAPGPMYSAIPVPVARGPPQPDQWILLTRPVGSPPLKILGGSALPKPVPWEKSPARRPSTGRAGWLAAEAEPGWLPQPASRIIAGRPAASAAVRATARAKERRALIMTFLR
jgi:hypothetical protein